MTSEKDAQEHSSLESLLSNWIARLPSAATSDCGKAKARRTASRTRAKSVRLASGTWRILRLKNGKITSRMAWRAHEFNPNSEVER
jgi:predicted oxidoreductase